MGIFGAGLATVIGEAVAILVMATHFFHRRNTLRLDLPLAPVLFSRKIVEVGFSVFLIDIAMGVLTVLFNRQILKYLGTDELAVYGVIVMVGTFVQCCGYGVGQAAQPILSQNYGAGAFGRVAQTLRYSVWTSILISVIWLALLMSAPDAFVRLFMRPTDTVLAVAPGIIRTYALAFVFLPFNVFSTYYFQATLQPRISFVVSLSRGLVVSGALILVLPPLFGGAALWWAIPLAEAAVAVYAILSLMRLNRRGSGI